MVAQSFNDVLEFIDSHTLDRTLYWQVKQLYSDAYYEVQWMSSKMWRFKDKKEESWTSCSTEDIVESLSQHKVDLSSFEMQVGNTALEQIVGAEFVVKAGRELFGDEAINKHLKAWDNFRIDLVSAINQIMSEQQQKKRKANFKVIKNDD